MNHHIRHFAVGCTVVLVLLAVVLVVLIAVRTWPAARTPPVEVNELGVDESLLPPYWRVCLGPTQFGRYATRGEQESAYWIFCTDGGSQSEYVVFRYRNEYDAAIAFRDLSEEFPRQRRHQNLATPEGWSSDTLVADSLEFECSLSDGSEYAQRCATVARYDEFVILFLADTSPVLATRDVERIVLSIDQRLAQALASHPLE
ncbi:MAG: hypothetical protein GX620_04830 [Chloroflexi bacterium]|nr:hypothetical protein [Chloroflexota bacterium]